jgi:hypothetical protein
MRHSIVWYIGINVQEDRTKDESHEWSIVGFSVYLTMFC